MRLLKIFQNGGFNEFHIRSPMWNHGEESLNSFSTHLNTLGSNLQFTLELEDNHKLPFLYVLIFNKSI